MLKSHMDAVENSLIHISHVPANSGHTLHKGTPREAFIKEFLLGHLNEEVAIGSGEIIDASSVPRAQRNQYDIVIYKRSFPKLDFGGGIHGFLIESVIATIEVKSILDQKAVTQSVKAARNAKGLTPHVKRVMMSGWNPPRVLNYVVAYDGPAHMKTARDWIDNAHASENITLPNWTIANRTETPGTALDGIFVLGKGFLKLDNTPLSFGDPNTRNQTHVMCDGSAGNLLMLFLALQEACSNLNSAWLDPMPYLQSATFPPVQFI